MTNRSVRAGETILLRTLIKDDLGDPTEASGLFVHIFDPDADILELSEAFIASGVPTYLGEGVFEFPFTPPLAGPEGVWSDMWIGELTGQTISGVMEFTVGTAGTIQSLDDQLFTNDIVQVTLTSGIQATDGTFLEEEFNLEFLVVTSPSYSSVRKVRLEIGAFINQLPDDILQMSILEASLEADVLTFAPVSANTSLFKHARREFVTCTASQILLTNVGSLLLRTKTLADLHVEYDTNGIRDATRRLIDCMDRWESQIIAGGGARASAQPEMVVKGINDPDRPLMSRMWQSTDQGNISRRIPAANTTTDNPHTRRQKKTFGTRFSRIRTGRKYW